jgi:hypothetical protein
MGGWMKAAGLLALVMASGCGRNAILNTQEDQRDDMLPELQGTWVSLCEASQVVTLKFEGDRLSVTQDKYHDPECRDARRSVSMGGTYSLAHNFKDGILNAMIFASDPVFQITLYSDYEVDVQNNSLTQVHNEKEAVIALELTPQQKRDLQRENLRLRETKALEMWKRSVAKSLNRLQSEKLNASSLGERPLADFETRTAFRYEMDNGFLQLNAPQIGNRVYTKR